MGNGYPQVSRVLSRSARAPARCAAWVAASMLCAAVSSEAAAQTQDISERLSTRANARVSCGGAQTREALRRVNVIDFGSGGTSQAVGAVNCVGDTGRFELFLPRGPVDEDTIIHELSHLDFKNTIQTALGARSCVDAQRVIADPELDIVGEIIAYAEEVSFRRTGTSGTALLEEAARRNTADPNFRNLDAAYRLTALALNNAGIPTQVIPKGTGRDFDVQGGDIDKLRRRREALAEKLIRERTGQTKELLPENSCFPDPDKTADLEEPPAPVDESAFLADYGQDPLFGLEVVLCYGPCPEVPNGVVIITDCQGPCVIPEVPEYEDPDYPDDDPTDYSQDPGYPSEGPSPGGGSSDPGGGSSDPGGGSSDPGGGSSVPGGGPPVPPSSGGGSCY